MSESKPGPGAPGAGTSAAGERLVAGQYRLLRQLGRGGMGVVWLAEDQLMGLQVAVKELRPPPGLSAADHEIFHQRALREARTAASIKHPNVVIIHNIVSATVEDDATYIVMELIEGPTLATVIARSGRLSDATVAVWGLQLLSVLEAAHAAGIVHRDIKPANIMLAGSGHVKLTDFGIAYVVDGTKLTRAGVIGTQAYLAPELFKSAPVTPAADLWSLGATLYAAVEGRGPFERENTAATLSAILIDELRIPRCSPVLAAVITGMLQRDPAKRITIQQARAQLQAAASGFPDRDSTVMSPSRDSTVMSPSRETTDKRRLLVGSPAGVTKFSNMPNSFIRALLSSGWSFVLVILIVIWPLTGGPHLTAFITVIVIYLLLMPVYLYLVTWVVMPRWFTLKLSAQGLIVERARKYKHQKKTVDVRWDKIMRVGPLALGSRTYLGARLRDTGGVPPEPVYLCPLGSADFPIEEIKAAILSYCPAAKIDPM